MAGAADPRLGWIDVIVVSHMHGEHLGNAHNAAPDSGSCEKPDVAVSSTPKSSAVEFALAKRSKFVASSEMLPFYAARLKATGGNPDDVIVERFGGSATVGGVRVAAVSALHCKALDPDCIGGDLGRAMKTAGIAGMWARRRATCCASATRSWPGCRAIRASSRTSASSYMTTTTHAWPW